MLARLNHKAARPNTCVHDAVPVADPTGTSAIRKRYTTLLDMRWRRFANMAKSALDTQDMLGLRPDKPTTLGLALSAMSPDAKTRAWQTWVDGWLSRLVIEGQADYLDPMIEAAYRKGMTRAQRMSSVVIAPNMRDVIWNLQQLTLVELQGICEAVSQRLVRLAASAMLDNVRPGDLVRETVKAIEQIGINRGRALIATMVVRSHVQATLDTFEAAGVRTVGLLPETVKPVRVGDAKRNQHKQPRVRNPGARMSRERPPSTRTIQRLRSASRQVEREFANTLVEVQTAGDDLVCPECEEIAADGPYTIDEARSLIPAHPNCRCTFVPEDEVVVPEGSDEPSFETPGLTTQPTIATSVPEERLAENVQEIIGRPVQKGGSASDAFAEEVQTRVNDTPVKLRETVDRTNIQAFGKPTDKDAFELIQNLNAGPGTKGLQGVYSRNFNTIGYFEDALKKLPAAERQRVITHELMHAFDQHNPAIGSFDTLFSRAFVDDRKTLTPANIKKFGYMAQQRAEVYAEAGARLITSPDAAKDPFLKAFPNATARLREMLTQAGVL